MTAADKVEERTQGAGLGSEPEDSGAAPPPDPCSVLRPSVLLPPAYPRSVAADTIRFGIAAAVHAAMVVGLLGAAGEHAGGPELDAITVDIIDESLLLQVRMPTGSQATSPAAVNEASHDPAAAQNEADGLRLETAVELAEPAPDPVALVEGTDNAQPKMAAASPGMDATAAPDPSAGNIAAAGTGRELTSDDATIPGRTNEYARMLLSALSRSRPKPTSPARGIVKVVFTVGTAGDVSEARVASSSGEPVLDEAALAAVRGTRFPPPPHGLTDAQRTYQIPYIFR